MAMAEIVEIATKVSTPLALGGLVAALMFFLLRQILARNIFPKLTEVLGARILRLIIDRLFVLALVSVILGFVGFLFSRIPITSPSHIYRIRASVINPQGMPVDDAQVWSSLGGEVKKVVGGWELEIPAGRTPTDGKLTIYAAVPSAFLTGRAELLLAREYNPAVTVPLHRDTTARIRGLVVDESGVVVAGARVSIAGHDSVTTTDESGGFLLPANAADGQQILIHVEKAGYRPLEQWHLAGNEPVHLTLIRLRRKT